MSRWYAVPAYRGARGIDGSPHVVDEAGQLVCTCELIEHAELIARLFNDSPEAADGRTLPGGGSLPSPPGLSSKEAA